MYVIKYERLHVGSIYIMTIANTILLRRLLLPYQNNIISSYLFSFVGELTFVAHSQPNEQKKRLLIPIYIIKGYIYKLLKAIIHKEIGNKQLALYIMRKNAY